jgi:tetratricopeptide (TPR) repeat protein
LNETVGEGMVMANFTNPYIAGAPLRGERGFYGRQDTLQWVRRELRNPATNALVLFGQRRIGKTTLLLQLQQTLPADQFAPVYFDLQDQATRSLSSVLADLADTMAEQAGLEPPDPETFDDRGRHFSTHFLPQLYAAIGQRRPVLLMDEFDVLDQAAEAELPETAAARSLFPFLRRLMLEESRLAFVFVVGRRAEDLTLDFSATFKASLTREIWTLDERSAVALVRQAEEEGSLRFSDAAVNRVLNLTNRHPYLTQLLCQRLWERCYGSSSNGVPAVDVSEVETAVTDALEAGYQAFAWLWDGLAPAEKIYAAAFAEVAHEGSTLAEDEVIQVLTAHASRLRTREVELAPRDLVQRRVLDAAGDQIYRFNVELFRRWVQKHKPLRDVKDELDQVDTTAEQLFRVGQSFFQRQQPENAIRYFQDALAANPRHFRARLYLGETLLQSGDLETAVAELEKAYQLDREEARLPLARALVTRARTYLEAQDEEAGLHLLERALAISPQERDAQTLRYEIWTRRGDQALQVNDLDTALSAYQQVGNREGVAKVNDLQTRRHLSTLEREAEAHEKAGRWEEALAGYEKLLAAAPGEAARIEWQERGQRAQQEQQLARRFAEGIGFLEQQAWDNAVSAFIDVIQQRPQYSRNGVLAVNLLQDAVQHEPGSHNGRRGDLRPYSQKIPLFHRWWRAGAALVALALLVFGAVLYEDTGILIFAAMALVALAAICAAIAVDHYQAERPVRGVIFTLAALPWLYEAVKSSRWWGHADVSDFSLYTGLLMLAWTLLDALYGQGVYPSPLVDRATKMMGPPRSRPKIAVDPSPAMATAAQEIPSRSWEQSRHWTDNIVTQSYQPLEDAEEIQGKFGANLFRGWEGVGGRIIVTNRRLLFEAHRYNVQREPLDIPLHDISDIVPSKTLYLVPNGITIACHSGQQYRFVVSASERKGIIAMIERQRAR